MNHVQLTYLNPSFRSFFIAVLFLSSPLPGAIDVAYRSIISLPSSRGRV
jgi:hypothetical protein